MKYMHFYFHVCRLSFSYMKLIDSCLCINSNYSKYKGKWYNCRENQKQGENIEATE